MNKDDEYIARRCGLRGQKLSEEFGAGGQQSDDWEDPLKARIERILNEPDERQSFSHRVRRPDY